MKIKVNDNVLILTGKDKGKTGKVIKTLRNEQKVVVEGINIAKRHVKPKGNNDQGGIFDIEMPIHVSNVKKIDEVKKTAKKEKVEAKKEESKKTTKKASK